VAGETALSPAFASVIGPILVIATREDLTVLQDVIPVLDAKRNAMNP
jgi:hypothetical protein